MTLPERVARYEAQLIEQALEGNTIRDAAAKLEISKFALERRLRRYRKRGWLSPRPKNWWQHGPSFVSVVQMARKLGLPTHRKTSKGKWKRTSKTDLQQLIASHTRTDHGQGVSGTEGGA